MFALAVSTVQLRRVAARHVDRHRGDGPGALRVRGLRGRAGGVHRAVPATAPARDRRPARGGEGGVDDGAAVPSSRPRRARRRGRRTVPAPRARDLVPDGGHSRREIFGTGMISPPRAGKVQIFT